jgi:N-dimethylarginine dimethylaminohydrolase
MTYTCQSETGKLKSLYLKRAADAFVSDNNLAHHWQALGYLGKPDFETAISEYSRFEDFLQAKGMEISYLPREEETGPDSIYCRDAMIATDQGMILCRMGKTARLGEPGAFRVSLEQKGMRILGSIQAPATLEGEIHAGSTNSLWRSVTATGPTPSDWISLGNCWLLPEFKR